jgi:hypothetical protein
MKLDDLPFEPDCELLPAVLPADTVKGFSVASEGWRVIIDCEGDLVAVVPADRAEVMKRVLNEAYEEHYEELQGLKRSKRH